MVLVTDATENRCGMNLFRTHQYSSRLHGYAAATVAEEGLKEALEPKLANCPVGIAVVVALAAVPSTHPLLAVASVAADTQRPLFHKPRSSCRCNQ